MGLSEEPAGMHIFKAQVTTTSFGEWYELLYLLSSPTTRQLDLGVGAANLLESP